MEKQLGDIVEIPLPNGQYAYGRVYKEYTIGIYKGFYNSFDEVKPDVEYFRFLGLYRSDLNRLRTVKKSLLKMKKKHGLQIKLQLMHFRLIQLYFRKI